MRVISGKYKKTNLDGFDIDGTRPTMDRVKESMFAMIQNDIKDSIVLDLFAGSGALGIEALSMGAKTCYFIDNNPIAINTINNNLKKVKELNNPVLKMDFLEALNYFKENNLKFNLILLDPPYKNNYLNKVIELVNKYDLLTDDGIIVCEYEDYELDYNKFTLYKQKTFSSKIVSILIK